MKKNMVTYKCRDCNGEFQVEQGSRRQLCPVCLVLSVTSGKKAKSKEVLPPNKAVEKKHEVTRAQSSPAQHTDKPSSEVGLDKAQLTEIKSLIDKIR